MKYTGNTVSKPVVGKEAQKLAKAIKTGGFVASPNAWVTINRIADQIKNEKLALAK